MWPRSAQSLLGQTDDFGNAFSSEGIDLTGFQPKVVATFPEIPSRPTVLEPGPFSHVIKASLIWYPTQGKLLLGWQVILGMPHNAGQYRVIVDASSGKILYRTQLADLLIARGSVYIAEGPPTERQTVAFPRPWGDYSVAFDIDTLPPGVPTLPTDWVDGPSTSGNSVIAHLGDGGPSVQRAE